MVTYYYCYCYCCCYYYYLYCHVYIDVYILYVQFFFFYISICIYTFCNYIILYPFTHTHTHTHTQWHTWLNHIHKVSKTHEHLFVWNMAICHISIQKHFMHNNLYKNNFMIYQMPISLIHYMKVEALRA